MKILALDPGKATGVALCIIDGGLDTFYVAEHSVVSLYHGIDIIVDSFKPDVIVAEQYRLYPQLARVQAFSTMVAAHVLGAIEYIAETRGIPLVEQTAAVGKSVQIPEDIYCKVRMYKTLHEKDAVKHAYMYCVRQRL